MLAGHRLALALGVVDSRAVLGDDDESRKQLIRAGEAMVNNGLAVVVNKAGTKQPICTLHAVERKHADQETRDAAAALGDPNSHKRLHRCGLAHAITDPKTATRVLTRLSKRGRFNLGIEPRASRLVVVDLDTAAQVNAFALRSGEDRPALTVRSPGAKDRSGAWVHKDGGHIYFEVASDIELPTNLGTYTDDDGWKVMWGECQVLAPPSARPEGSYVLIGSAHPLPDWLYDLIVSESMAKNQRSEESARRRENSQPTQIDEWSRSTSWGEILIADGWTDIGIVDSCGCPIWTAPGDHASPKSATAHEPGCAVYVCDRGHGPLHVWTDDPSPAVRDAITEYRSRTLTMVQVRAYTEGDGRMGQMLEELGIERPGPTVLRRSLERWEDVEDESGEDTEEEELDDDEARARAVLEYEERQQQIEDARQRRIKRARERLAAEDAPVLRVFSTASLIHAPRPGRLV